MSRPVHKLPRDFYEQGTLTVAQKLLGMLLIHNSAQGVTGGKIVETEAYIGPWDQASHAYKNRRTKRTEVQFGPAGYGYIYQIYGNYFCFNVVTQKTGKPEVVLVRALEPVEGIPLMAHRRGFTEVTRANVGDLANGPGKLCCAMGIDKSLYGVDLCQDTLFIARPDSPYSIDVISTPRINIDYAGEAKPYPWRFVIKGNRFVSKRVGPVHPGRS